MSNKAKFEMLPITADMKRGWKVKLDDKEVEANKVDIESPQWGKVTYGKRPEGFDSWTYLMKANAVTVPYFITGRFKKKLIVGLIQEDRPNMGGIHLCVIGGFTDPKETLEKAQARELSEEAGLVGVASKIGDLMVTDRLFFNASVPGYGGNYTFSFKVPKSAVLETAPGEWKANPASKYFKDMKKSSSLVFLEWTDAVQSSHDGVALAALARMRMAFELGHL